MHQQVALTAKTQGDLSPFFANTHLKGTQHLCDAFFFFVDEQHVFQDDGASFVTGVYDQSTGSEQHVFEHVVDLLVDSQIWC